MISWVSMARAATVDVCAVGCDHASIEDALDDPTATTIEVRAGSYDVDDLVIDRSLSILGAGSATTTLRVVGDDVFDITDDVANLVISGFTWKLVEEGSGLEFDGKTNATVTDIVVTGHLTDELGGVVDLGASTLLMEDWVVSDLESSADGGVVSVDGGSLTIRDCVFTSIATTADGGVIHATDATVVLDGVTVDGAAADHGGFAALRGGTLDALDIAIDNASAVEDGGAIFLAEGATMIGSGVEIDGAVATNGAGLYLAAGTSADIVSASWTAGEADQGGAIWLGADSVLTCLDCGFEGHRVAEAGGCIAAGSGAKVELPGLFAADNSAAAGGAVWADGSSVVLDGAVLLDNSADAGGSLYALDATTEVWDTTFSDGLAVDGSGGDIACVGGTLAVEGGLFERGEASDSGGSIVLQACDADIDGSEFDVGTAGDGGALAAADSDVDLTDVSMRSLLAGTAGGAVWTQGGALTVVTSEFLDNVTSTGGGGALYTRETDLRIEGSRFEGNSAAGSGGAVDQENGDLTVVDSHFEGNASDATGGGLRSNRSDLTTVLRTVFCANKALDGGGASQALADGGKDHLWANNVFVGNEADAAGGGLRLSSSAVTVVHNDLLDGAAATDGGGAWGSAASGIFHSNLVAYNGAGSGLEASASPALSVDWDGWWENIPSHADVALGAHAVVADPMLIDVVPGIGCDDFDTQPDVGSPLFHAGDPDYPNPDGTPGHIGSWGGPWANPTSFIDGDGDGATWIEDCDDGDPDRFPGALEVCNDVDDDCDGLVDGLDDSLDPDSGIPIWLDADGDGWGGVFLGYACTVPPLTSDTDGDCDDGNPNVNPDAVEVCNGRDDDCDGLTDDADPGLDPDSTETFHVDADGDGWGGEDEVFACELPDGAAALMGDCDDRAPAVFPGAPELCNGIDDDCDGRTDDEDEVAVGNPGLFIDADGDGVGSVEAVACAVGDGVVDVSGDCNDADATVYPGAVDECGGGDNDCDGLIDEDGTPLEWYIDADGDGFGDEVVLACEPPEGTVVFAGDCDDSDPTRYPGAPEVPDDGIDQDCDGLDAAGAPGPSTGTRTIPEDELEAPRAPAQPDPGCACDTRGGPTPALAALGALFALRRRPRRS